MAYEQLSRAILLAAVLASLPTCSRGWSHIANEELPQILSGTETSIVACKFQFTSPSQGFRSEDHRLQTDSPLQLSE